MNYNTVIKHENGGYVGSILLNEQIIYTSPLLADPVLVSRDLSNHFTKIAESIQPVQPKVETPKVQTEITSPANITSISAPFVANQALPPDINLTTVPPPPMPARRCCGRG